MLHQPDKDGRYPLSGKEYEALRTLFGAVNALSLDAMKDRLEILGCWEEYENTHKVMRRIMEKLLTTIPQKKLQSIHRDLAHTICEIKVRPPVGDAKHEVTIDQAILIRLMERAIAMDCFCCQKTAKEGLRCQLYKDLNACFPYELTDPGEAVCPFSEQSILTMD